MNKIIFQIGLLAWCITFVICSTQDLPLLESLLKSFLVFVSTVIIAAFVLYGAATVEADHLMEQKRREKEMQDTDAGNHHPPQMPGAARPTGA